MEPSQRPDPPTEPLRLASRWLEDARTAGAYRNPSAMALATADAAGKPAVRMVLLKSFSIEDGYAVFYTNYESRKGRELAQNPRAAGALYWEQLGRQLRLEGYAVASPAPESDAYFMSRPLGSRINACVSDQSRPLDDFADLDARMGEKRAEVEASGGQCLRPEHWGGYRLWLDRVEFWTEGNDRFHERIAYERKLTRRDGGFVTGQWTRMLLQP